MLHSARPVLCSPLSGSRAKHISAGFTRSAAVTVDNQLVVWGASPWVDLTHTALSGRRDPLRTLRWSAMESADLEAAPARVAVGPAHLVIADEAGHVWHQGEFPGDPKASYAADPVLVLGGVWGHTVASMAAGWDHSIVVMRDATAFTWGRLPFTPQVGQEEAPDATPPSTTALEGPGSLSLPHFTTDLQGPDVPEVEGTWVPVRRPRPLAKHDQWRMASVATHVPGQVLVEDLVPATPDTAVGQGGAAAQPDTWSTHMPNHKNLFRTSALPSGDSPAGESVLPVVQCPPLAAALGLTQHLKLSALSGYMRWLPIASPNQAPAQTEGGAGASAAPAGEGEAADPLDASTVRSTVSGNSATSALTMGSTPPALTSGTGPVDTVLHSWLASCWVSHVQQTDDFLVLLLHPDPALQVPRVVETAAKYCGAWSLPQALGAPDADAALVSSALQASVTTWSAAWHRLRQLLALLSTVRVPGWDGDGARRGPGSVHTSASDGTKLSESWVRGDSFATVILRQLVREWADGPKESRQRERALKAVVRAVSSNPFDLLADGSSSEDEDEGVSGAAGEAVAPEGGEEGSPIPPPSPVLAGASSSCSSMAALSSLLREASNGSVTGEEDLGQGVSLATAIALLSLPVHEQWLRLADQALHGASVAAGSALLDDGAATSIVPSRPPPGTTLLWRNPPASKAVPSSEALNVALLHEMQEQAHGEWVHSMLSPAPSPHSAPRLPCYPTLALVWHTGDRAEPLPILPTSLQAAVADAGALVLPMALAVAASPVLAAAASATLLELHDQQRLVEAGGGQTPLATGTLLVPGADGTVDLWSPPPALATAAHELHASLPPRSLLLLNAAELLPQPGSGLHMQASQEARREALAWAAACLPLGAWWGSMLPVGRAGAAAPQAVPTPDHTQPRAAAMGGFLSKHLKLAHLLQPGLVVSAGHEPGEASGSADDADVQPGDISESASLALLHASLACVDALALQQRSTALEGLRHRYRLAQGEEGEELPDSDEADFADGDDDEEAEEGVGVTRRRRGGKARRTGRRTNRGKGRTRADDKAVAVEWAEQPEERLNVLERQRFGEDAVAKGKRVEVLEGGGYVLPSDTPSTGTPPPPPTGSVVSRIKELATPSKAAAPEESAAAASDAAGTELLSALPAGVVAQAGDGEESTDETSTVASSGPTSHSETLKRHRKLKARLDRERFLEFKAWHEETQAEGVHVSQRGAQGADTRGSAAGWGSLADQTTLSGDAAVAAREAATHAAFLAATAGQAPDAAVVEEHGFVLLRSDADHDFMHSERATLRHVRAHLSSVLAEVRGGATAPQGPLGGVTVDTVLVPAPATPAAEEQVLPPDTGLFLPHQVEGGPVPATDVDIVVGYGPRLGLLWWEPDPTTAPAYALRPRTLKAPVAPMPTPVHPPLPEGAEAAASMDALQAFLSSLPQHALASGMTSLVQAVYRSVGLTLPSPADLHFEPELDLSGVKSQAARRRLRTKARAAAMDEAAQATVPRSLLMSAAAALTQGDVLLMPAVGSPGLRSSVAASGTASCLVLSQGLWAHSWLLAKRVPALASLLPASTDPGTVPVVHLPLYVTPAVLQAALQYLYTGRCSIRRGTAVPLLRLGHAWRLPGLHALAEHYLVCGTLRTCGAEALADVLAFARCTGSVRLSTLAAAEASFRGCLGQALAAAKAKLAPPAATVAPSAAAAGSADGDSASVGGAGSVTEVPTASPPSQHGIVVEVASRRGGTRLLRGAWAQSVVASRAAAARSAVDQHDDDPGGGGDPVSDGAPPLAVSEPQPTSLLQRLRAEAGVVPAGPPPPKSYPIRGGARPRTHAWGLQAASEGTGTGEGAVLPPPPADVLGSAGDGEEPVLGAALLEQDAEPAEVDVGAADPAGAPDDADDDVEWDGGGTGADGVVGDDLPGEPVAQGAVPVPPPPSAGGEVDVEEDEEGGFGMFGDDSE